MGLIYPADATAETNARRGHRNCEIDGHRGLR